MRLPDVTIQTPPSNGSHAEPPVHSLPEDSESLSNHLLPVFRTHVPESLILAIREDNVVGSAAVMVTDQTAVLVGACTNPEMRRQGVYRELMRARLDQARMEGCDLAVLRCVPGSVAQYSAERFGFRLAYTSLVLIREP
jgi:GNAT superfamily N-acetyltransferase